MSTLVAVQEIEGGRACLLCVRARPGAKKGGLVGEWNGVPKIAVDAPALDGRANERLVNLVAQLFDLRPSAVSLVAGEKARVKKLRLAASAEVIRAKLDALYADT